MRKLPAALMSIFFITYAALLIFGAVLVADRLFPIFVPIRSGYFPALAVGILVICIGISSAREISRQISMRRAAEAQSESVTKMLEAQKAHYPALIEMEQEIRTARHDLRHHINLFRELLTGGDTESLKSYLDMYSDYSDSQAATIRISYCGHYVTDMLLGMYSRFAERQGTAFLVQANISETLTVLDADLCVILSNLLENALEASAKLPKEKREIIVRIGEKRGQLIILIENSFDGVLIKKHGRILSSKRNNRQGVGLSSVKATVSRYGGNTEFYARKYRFYSEIYLPSHREGV